jgi:hypothetical protein
VPANQDDEETTAPEPHVSFQGESAIAAIKGDRTIAQFAEQFDVIWKAQLDNGAAGVFGPGGGKAAEAT